MVSPAPIFTELKMIKLGFTLSIFINLVVVAIMLHVFALVLGIN